VQVKANREAPTLDLTKAEDVTKPTTAGWNATFTPQTDMEKEVAAMLTAGGAGSARAVQVYSPSTHPYVHTRGRACSQRAVFLNPASDSECRGVPLRKSCYVRVERRVGVVGARVDGGGVDHLGRRHADESHRLSPPILREKVAEGCGADEHCGGNDEKRPQEGEELELKQLTVEEAEARRGKLRKLRVLMFKHEMRAKHIKKIKSRAFHKANKKKKGNAGTRRFPAPHPNLLLPHAHLSGTSFIGWSDGGRVRSDGFGCAGDMDPEETREAALRQEWERAKERLTLKHRNTSRWAQRILKKGLQLNQVGSLLSLAVRSPFEVFGRRCCRAHDGWLARAPEWLRRRES